MKSDYYKEVHEPHKIINKYKIDQDVCVVTYEYINDILEPIIQEGFKIDNIYIKYEEFYYYKLRHGNCSYGQLVSEKNIFKNENDVLEYIEDNRVKWIYSI